MKKLISISPVTNDLLMARARELDITQSTIVEIALDIYFRIIDSELELSVKLVDKLAKNKKV